VFGFLSLKEPSQLAFEQYAETQRKQALERSTATPTSRPVSTYAAKKLPKNVPRVNSKWDGVPDSLKNRYAKSSYSKSSSGSNKNRHSVMTQSSQDSGLTVMSWNNESKFSVMTDGSRNPPNSIASVARPLSTLTVRDEVQSLPPPPSTTPPPEVTYYYSEPRISGALSVESSLETYRPSSFDIPQIQDSPYDIVLQADHFSRPRADSPASSTDSVNTVVRDTADAIFKKLNDRPQNSLWGDAPPVGSLDRVDEPAVPESHDFLFDLPAAEEVWGDDDDSGAPPPIPHYAPTRPVHNSAGPCQRVRTHGRLESYRCQHTEPRPSARACLLCMKLHSIAMPQMRLHRTTEVKTTRMMMRTPSRPLPWRRLLCLHAGLTLLANDSASADVSA
jgi:hypothetical protein